MPNDELKTFDKNFWNYYNQKNYSQIIKDIPKLLDIKCGPNDVRMYQKLCAISLMLLRRDKIVDSTHVTGICNKYQTVIANTEDPIMTLNYFIGLEYMATLDGISSSLISNVAPAVMNKIKSNELLNLSRAWTDKDRKTLNRFIVVVVELESELASSNLWTPTFATAHEAIEFFATVTTDIRKTAYPEYLLSTLKVLLSYQDDNGLSVDELHEKIMSTGLAKNEHGKDIAIMSSQIIRAGTLLISKGSTLFKLKVVTVLNELYEIVRNKSLTACEYSFHKTYDVICCERSSTHAGLQIMETVRSIFVVAFKAGNFDEALVSVMANFAKAESEILSYFDCKNVDQLKQKFRQTIVFVTDNIEKIVTTCGLDRAKRTLEKFLSCKVLQPGECVRIIKEWLKICKDTGNKAERITWMAMKIMFNTEPKNRFSCMFELHELQKQLDDPKQFEIISSIVKGLPKQNYPLHLDPVQLQLLQINVEIDYPRLPALCLQKLVDDVCKMDFYKNDHGCYAILCKSAVCYLQCVVHKQQYKSNVKYDKWYDPLNEKFVLLEKEAEMVEKLKEALGYLEKFIRCMDSLMGNEDSTGCIPLAEKLLLKIGRTLMNRHYKELAVIAFDLLYKFAKRIDHPLNQMIAAGYLIENIHLTSTISEKKIVTELLNFIMQTLRDVNSMSVDDLGSFLFGFLQLTIYTMRHQRNIAHAKKYMQAINKLLNKYDSGKEKYLPAQLKYAEVMFELIVKDLDTTITPVTYIEDIFHRFKQARCVTRQDFDTLPGIVLDLLITLHEFTQPRYELRVTSSLCALVHFASLRNGYLFLTAKTVILTSNDNVLINGKHLEDLMKQLDVIFNCSIPAVPTETEGEKSMWNTDITSLIHTMKCKCLQCRNKCLNTLTMDVATVKASAIYYKKDYGTSLESFKRIYSHWTALNTLSYSGMLIQYSNCLISNHREEKSNAILKEALDLCNDYAQAQDISNRLLFNAKKDELTISDELARPYADEVRRKTVHVVHPVQQSKRKVNSQPNLPAAAAIKERKTYPKRTNLRN